MYSSFIKNEMKRGRSMTANQEEKEDEFIHTDGFLSSLNIIIITRLTSNPTILEFLIINFVLCMNYDQILRVTLLNSEKQDLISGTNFS
jgi:hypothetical protein